LRGFSGYGYMGGCDGVMVLGCENIGGCDMVQNEHFYTTQLLAMKLFFHYI
jgi:hypothetical protein